jgi:hypothetical protein
MQHLFSGLDVLFGIRRAASAVTYGAANVLSCAAVCAVVVLFVQINSPDMFACCRSCSEGLCALCAVVKNGDMHTAAAARQSVCLFASLAAVRPAVGTKCHECVW